MQTRARPGAVASLPDDMQAVWAARLDRILEAAHLDVYASRRALELAAIFGETTAARAMQQTTSKRRWNQA